MSLLRLVLSGPRFFSSLPFCPVFPYCHPTFAPLSSLPWSPHRWTAVTWYNFTSSSLISLCQLLYIPRVLYLPLRFFLLVLFLCPRSQIYLSSRFLSLPWMLPLCPQFYLSVLSLSRNLSFLPDFFSSVPISIFLSLVVFFLSVGDDLLPYRAYWLSPILANWITHIN